MTVTQETVLEGIRADWDALEQIASLVYELYVRCAGVQDASGPVEVGARSALAHGVNLRLHELGVDLNLPDLSALLASTVAATPTATSSTAAPEPDQDVTADGGEQPNNLAGLVTDVHWQPGDPCSACESTNTGRASNGAAYCLDCGARDVDERDDT